jgi:Methylamine utilisation protein MauE
MIKGAGSVAKYFVGGLFIFSGLIKINDPIGFAIKLSEYFEVFAADIHPLFHVFVPLSLFLAVTLCLMEVVLGVNLLIHSRPKLTIWFLFGIIVFFSFLTFYSAYFNKVTDCGCFGDAIALTPWQSFTKDLVLLFFILILIWRREDFEPLLPQRARYVIFSATLVIGFVLSEISIRHLPMIDFRAYKVGTNISESMKASAPLQYEYIMEKDGREFTLDQYPSDTAFKFIRMDIKNPEAQPKITDYSIWNDEGDFTDQSLSGTKMFLIIQDIGKIKKKAWKKMKPLLDAVGEDGIELMVITSSGPEQLAPAIRNHGLPGTYYFADATVLKTIVRSNPGYLILKDGGIMGKWHWRDTPTLKKINKKLNS